MSLLLRSLTIKSYEQYANESPITFSDKENLLIGLNGSGKTTLLRLIEAVLSFQFAPLATKDFDIEFEAEDQIPIPKGGRRLTLKGTARNEVSKASADTVTAPDNLQQVATERKASFEFDLKVTSEASDVVEFKLANGQPSVKHNGNSTPVDFLSNPYPYSPLAHFALRVNPANQAIFPILSQLRMYDGRAAKRLREGIDDFSALLDEVSFSIQANQAGQAVRVTPPQDLDQREYFHALVPLLNIKHVWSQLHHLKSELRYNSADTPQIRNALAALHASDLSLRLKIAKESQISGNLTDYSIKGIDLRLRFESGTEVAGAELTFGQKRFLVFALLLGSNVQKPAIIDELDNGFHPGLVEQLMRIVHPRQSFFSSHNKLVLDYLNFLTPEDVRKTIHFCERDQHGKLIVSRLTEQNSQQIFEKISIGIMKPSEVLIAEGLW